MHFYQHLTLIVGICFVLLSCYVVLQKSSACGGVRNPGPFWLHFVFEIPVYVVGGIVAWNYFYFDGYWLYRYIGQQEIFMASLWLIYGMILYCWLFLWLTKSNRFNYKEYKIKEDVKFVSLAISIILIASLIIISDFGRNLPILQVFSTDELGVIRKQAKMSASIYLSLIVDTFGYLGIVYAGLNWIHRKNISVIYVLFVASLLAGGWYGSKSGLALQLILFYFAYYWGANKKITFRKAFVFGAIVFSIIFFMFAVALKYTDNTNILEAIIFRISAAQSSGYFQAFGNVPDIKYLKAWIPFSGIIFNDVPSFARDAMTVIYGDTDTNGVRNSIFMAEAYGTIGVLGLIFSPIIVCVGAVILSKFFYAVFSRLVGNKFGTASVFILVKSTALTGGFASKAFMSGGIRLFVLILAFSLGYQLLKKSLERNRIKL